MYPLEKSPPAREEGHANPGNHQQKAAAQGLMDKGQLVHALDIFQRLLVLQVNLRALSRHGVDHLRVGDTGHHQHQGHDQRRRDPQDDVKAPALDKPQDIHF